MIVETDIIVSMTERSETERTSCNTSDNVCGELQDWRTRYCFKCFYVTLIDNPSVRTKGKCINYR